MQTLEQLEIFLINKEDGGMEELNSNFSELTNNEYQEDRYIQIFLPLPVPTSWFILRVCVYRPAVFVLCGIAERRGEYKLCFI